MNDRLLKKLILKEIHSVLNEGDDSGDMRRYAVLVNEIGNKLEEAQEMAESLGRDYDVKHLRNYVTGIDSLIEIIESDADRHSGHDDEGDED